MSKVTQPKPEKASGANPPSNAPQVLRPAQISVLFGPLQPGVPQSYYAAKMGVLTQFYFPGTPIADAGSVTPAVLKLTPKENLPAVTKPLQKNIDCLLETADDDFPLLPNEYVTSDFVTTLADAVNDIPAGTVVLERITNYATLYYVVLNTKMEGKTPVWQELHLGGHEELHAHMALGAGDGKTSLPLTIAKGIGMGMVSTVGGFIATSILEAIFPPGVPDYFDEVYKEITKIVDQKVDQSRIDSINGAISNLVDKLANEYKPAKDISNLKLEKDRRRLYELLQKYDQTFLSGPGGMLGSLQQDQIAKPGFAVFMLGAAIQLAIFQEIANIDPYNGDEKNGWKSPLQSSYGLPKTGSIAKMAKNYADFATKTWTKIANDRKNQVKAEKFEKRLQPKKHNKYATMLGVDYYVRVNDNGAATSVEKKIGKSDKDGNNPRYNDFCSNQLVTYKNQKVAELSTRMSEPEAVINSWLKLIDTPVKTA